MRYVYLTILVLASLAYPLTRLAAMERPPFSTAAPAAAHSPATISAAALEALLVQYQQKAATGGWPSFKATAKKIEPGDMSDRIPTIRAILVAMGDLKDADAPTPDLYDETLVAAVKQFQLRHGLEDDGVLGKETQIALNTPVEKRIRQIEATLARLQEFTPDMSTRTIVVNLPEFMLRGYNGGQQVLEMKVIDGSPKNPTPLFTKQMTYVSFNPHWGVPIRIAAEEMLPKILENPEFFNEQNFEVFELTADGGRHAVDPSTVDWTQHNKDHFPYLLRQRPGKDNALGKIKFGLKDSNDIYMHDTSNPKLFAKDIRALSHGCMRLEKPYEMAQFVFEGKENFDKERLDSFYNGDESRIFTIPPVTVHTVYWTAWVDEKTGLAHFRKDIYNLDK